MSKTNTTVDAAFPQEYHDGVKKLQGMVAEVNKGNIEKNYEIGQLVVEMTTKPEYGKPSVKKLAESFPVGYEILRPARDVALKFNKKDFETAIKLVGPKGQKLTWSHMSLLAQVKDNKEAGELAKKTVNEGWDVKQLKRQVKGVSATNSPKGRKPNQATSFVDLVGEVKDRTNGYSNYLDTNFSDDEAVLELFDVVKNKLGDKRTNLIEVLDAVDLSIEQMTLKASAAQAVLVRLKGELERGLEVDDEDEEDDGPSFVSLDELDEDDEIDDEE